MVGYEQDESIITADEYQKITRETAIYPAQGMVPRGDLTALTYLALGLASETGEICSKLKKIIRDKDGKITVDDLEGLKNESADCLWYLARLLDEMNYSFSSALQDNLDKLFDRKNRGVLQGSGDSR